MTESERAGLIGLGHRIAGNLPAQFMLLCLINIIFLGVIAWLIDGAAEYRERLIAPIVDACLHPKP